MMKKYKIVVIQDHIFWGFDLLAVKQKLFLLRLKVSTIVKIQNVFKKTQKYTHVIVVDCTQVVM